jgi:hypothetical protein
MIQENWKIFLNFSGKEFGKFWSDRENLPEEYYIISFNLNNETIKW